MRSCCSDIRRDLGEEKPEQRENRRRSVAAVLLGRVRAVGRLAVMSSGGTAMPRRHTPRLLHGPYNPPAVRRGDLATCLYRDSDVIITGVSSLESRGRVAACPAGVVGFGLTRYC